MRILVVNPFGGTEAFGRENLARVARSDTEFDVVNYSGGQAGNCNSMETRTLPATMSKHRLRSAI